MSYIPAWTHADAQGRVTAEQWVSASDVQELIDSVNRRRRLVYQAGRNFSVEDMISTLPLPALREEITDTILTPTLGGQGGTPPTPAGMDWLWPVADANENGVLQPDDSGDVSLFEQLNGTNDWTDASLSAEGFVKAVHMNELRQALEWTSRGRWTLPLYWASGLFSVLPDTPWAGESVANNGTHELRSIGYAVFRGDGSPTQGLADATARATSKIEITADRNCTVDLYRVKRWIDFGSDLPTWNEYDPSASEAWQSPGGLGANDVAYVGTLNLTADTPGTLSGEAVRAAFQDILDGAHPFFLLRRTDVGPLTVFISSKVVVEFDLSTPPS